MTNLSLLSQELCRAKEKLELYINTEDEIYWRDFINCIEQSFTDELTNTKGTDYYQMVHPMIAFKREDPLLNYIRKSRNMIHHGGSALIVYKEVRNLSKNDTDVELISFTVESKDENGEKYTEKLKINNESYLMLKPILASLPDKNEGTIFPPKTHLNIPLIDPTSPIEVGRLAIKFYTDLYTRVYEKKIADW
jgi:hypothetical protein